MGETPDTAGGVPDTVAQSLSTSDWLLLSFQAASSEGRTNHRPDFIQLSNQSPDLEDHVLYPEQWEDRVSLAERYDRFSLVDID